MSGALFLAASAIIYVQHRSWTPHIICESPSMDLGVVTSDEPLDCLFDIRNNGLGELHISKVTTGCACTAVPFYKEHLVPGESTVIPVRLDVKGRHGLIKQMVMLTTNDPAHRQFPLRLTADIQISTSTTTWESP